MNPSPYPQRGTPAGVRSPSAEAHPSLPSQSPFFPPNRLSPAPQHPSGLPFLNPSPSGWPRGAPPSPPTWAPAGRGGLPRLPQRLRGGRAAAAAGTRSPKPRPGTLRAARQPPSPAAYVWPCMPGTARFSPGSLQPPLTR